MRIRTLCLLTALLLFTGCRTYGGHGSEEATYAQILEALDRYEAFAERMQADAQELANASDQNPLAASYSLRFADIVVAQEATLDKIRHLAAGVSSGSSYRALNRTLGAVISEQEVIDDRYDRLVADIINDPELDRQAPYMYTIVPAVLARLEASLLEIPVRDAVRIN